MLLNHFSCFLYISPLCKLSVHSHPFNITKKISPLKCLTANLLHFPGDPIAFLSWFLNALHLALGGTASKSSSIIYKTFRGKLKIYSRKIPPVEMVIVICGQLWFLFLIIFFAASKPRLEFKILLIFS